MRNKRPILDVLAGNLRALMSDERHRVLSTSPKVAMRSGVAQRTVNNMQKGRHDPQLSTIEAIARAFNLSAYQLLCPSEDRDALKLLHAWQVGTASDRELLLAAAETVTRRHANHQPKSSTPGTAHG
jgi:transcriptional regulator with XRE-family HTH domain